MAEDPTEISVQGIWESLSRRYINVTFTVCDASFGVECLPEKEIDSFLSEHLLTVFTSENFIDFSEVESVEDTLK